MGPTAAIALVLACYALGCVVTSYYVVKWRTGSDLRRTGSGTTGSTNAGRILGKKAYLILTLLDIFKGWIAVFVAAGWGLRDWWLAAAGLAVVCGHIWPVQLGFRGGKGLSTGYGVIIAVAPWVALFMWAIFGLCWLVFRSSTLAVVQAFLSAPLLAIGFRYGASDAVADPGYLNPVTALVTVIAALICVTHARNIRDALQRRRAHPVPSTDQNTA